MSDPSALLKAVHDDLVTVGDEAKAIQAFGDPRGRLGAGVVAAIADAARGDEAGCKAAIGHLEAVRGEAGDFKNDDQHRRAQDVARAALKALPALRAIDWHGGGDVSGPPVISVAQDFAQVVPSATTPVTKTVALKRDGDASDTLAVNATISGLLQGSDFQQGAMPSLQAVFAPGARSATMSVSFAPQHLTTKRQGRFDLTPPPGAKLGATSGFNFALVPQGPGNTGDFPSGLPWPSGVTMPSNDPKMIDAILKFATFRGRAVDVVNVKSVGTKGWPE